MDAKEDADDVLRARGWRQRSLPGFAGLIGPLWTRKEERAWAYGVLATDDHTNPSGVVHGGMLTALLDHALRSIAWEALERHPCVTLQIDTHFLFAARPGQFLEARGHVVRATSSLVFMQGNVSAEGVQIATACALLKAAGASPRSERT